MQLPQEFFTFQSMMTLTGATGATFAVANGCQHAFNFNPKWLALVIAQMISIYGTINTGGSGSDYFVGVINGFLIFCTAAGATTVVGHPGTKGVSRGLEEAGMPSTFAERRFLSSWF